MQIILLSYSIYGIAQFWDELGFCCKTRLRSIDTLNQLKWEKIKNEGEGIGIMSTLMTSRRTKVPGGWLVLCQIGSFGAGLTFYPDPNHQWNGNSLP